MLPGRHDPLLFRRHRPRPLSRQQGRQLADPPADPVTKVYESGVYLGESKSVEQLRGVFANDGTTVLSSRIHTRSRVGEEDCVYHMVLKIVDYEVTVDHTTSTCGSPV